MESRLIKGGKRKDYDKKSDYVRKCHSDPVVQFYALKLIFAYPSQPADFAGLAFFYNPLFGFLVGLPEKKIGSNRGSEKSDGNKKKILARNYLGNNQVLKYYPPILMHCESSQDI